MLIYRKLLIILIIIMSQLPHETKAWYISKIRNYTNNDTGLINLNNLYNLKGQHPLKFEGYDIIRLSYDNETDDVIVESYNAFLDKHQFKSISFFDKEMLQKLCALLN